MCIFWAWIRKSFTTEKAENSISIETELNWKNWLLVWFHIMYEKISIISVEIGGLLKCMNVNVVYYYINIFICFQSCPIDNVYIVYCMYMSCLPENQHLGWVRVTFLDNFSSLSWASFLCKWAKILICWCLTLLE